MITMPLGELEQFYVPFARLDEEKRTVCGYAFTSPRVRGDKWNLKRTTLERAAPRYMEMPCVRSMHSPVAAGKALAVRFDDKGAFIEAYIGDDNEWRKCQEGIYRGFSIGGKPLLVRGDDIEEFDWVETSLVDRPKDPGALFTVVRAESSAEDVEVRVLPGDSSDAEVERVLRDMGTSLWGNREGLSDSEDFELEASPVSLNGLDEVTRLEAELFGVRTHYEAAVRRLEAAEEEAKRWENETQRVQAENVRLRELPYSSQSLERTASSEAGSAQAVERGFALNDLLGGSGAARRAALLDEKARLLSESAKNEGEASARFERAARLIAIDWALGSV